MAAEHVPCHSPHAQIKGRPSQLCLDVLCFAHAGIKSATLAVAWRRFMKRVIISLRWWKRAAEWSEFVLLLMGKMVHFSLQILFFLPLRWISSFLLWVFWVVMLRLVVRVWADLDRKWTWMFLLFAFQDQICNLFDPQSKFSAGHTHSRTFLCFVFRLKVLRRRRRVSRCSWRASSTWSVTSISSSSTHTST